MSRGSKGKTTRSRVLVGMELDPTRIDEAADPKVNTLQLWLTAQKIFSSITHSSRDMPQELAEMLVFIHDTVKEKFQGQEVALLFSPPPLCPKKQQLTNHIS